MSILQNARLSRGVTYCKNDSDEMVPLQTQLSVNGISDASDTDYINLYLSQLPPEVGYATKSSAGID